MRHGLDAARAAGHALVLLVGDPSYYAQFGFEDEAGRPVPGFSVDDCVYVNGNHVEHEVAWLSPDGALRRDLGELRGRTLRLVARMRGASLYAIQFPSAP